MLSFTSSARLNRRRIPAAASAAKTAAMRPMPHAATRMGLRGFDGLDGTGAGPSESSSTSAPSELSVTTATVLFATAFTVAATAPGSVPLPWISSVSVPEFPVAEMSTAAWAYFAGRAATASLTVASALAWVAS